MTKMMIQCKNCGIKFASLFQEGEESFKIADEIDVKEKCPKCGLGFKYNKSDVSFE
jgi:hypothetical protein